MWAYLFGGVGAIGAWVGGGKYGRIRRCRRDTRGHDKHNQEVDPHTIRWGGPDHERGPLVIRPNPPKPIRPLITRYVTFTR